MVPRPAPTAPRFDAPFDWSRIPTNPPAPPERSSGADGATTVARGGPLPFFGAIQRSFGRHDLGAVQAHTDAQAAAAARTLGAEAFTVREHVAFAGEPSLETAAHEAAHVVQQRSGAVLAGGAGQEGDRHERHADVVARRVVAGQSSEALLDAYTGAGPDGARATSAGVVQCKEKKKKEKEKSPTTFADLSHDEIRDHLLVAQQYLFDQFSFFVSTPDPSHARPESLTRAQIPRTQVVPYTAFVALFDKEGEYEPGEESPYTRAARVGGFTEGGKISLNPIKPTEMLLITLVHELVHTLVKWKLPPEAPLDLEEAATQLLAVCALRQTKKPELDDLSRQYYYIDTTQNLYVLLALLVGDRATATDKLAETYFQGKVDPLKSIVNNRLGSAAAPRSDLRDVGWKIFLTSFRKSFVWHFEKETEPYLDTSMRAYTGQPAAITLMLLEGRARLELRKDDKFGERYWIVATGSGSRSDAGTGTSAGSPGK
jgi:hypothetical protein